MQSNSSRNSLDNKIRKKKLELKGDISCGLCPYNKKENANRQQRPDKYKSYRKGKI